MILLIDPCSKPFLRQFRLKTMRRVRKRERIVRYFDELRGLRERIDNMKVKIRNALSDGRRDVVEEEEQIEEEKDRGVNETELMRREERESRYVQECVRLKQMEHRQRRRIDRDRGTLLPLNSALRRLVEEKTSKLRMLKRKRISELFEIYPITKKEEYYCIRDKSFSQIQLDEGVRNEMKRIEGAAALGHCAKLMITLAQYMNITLIHEIRFCGSESCILDDENKSYNLFPSSSSSSFTKALDLLDVTARRLSSSVLNELDVDIKILSIAFPERLSSSSCRYSRSIFESLYAVQCYCTFDDGKSWRHYLSLMDQRNRLSTSPVRFQRGGNDGEWDIVHWENDDEQLDDDDDDDVGDNDDGD